MPQPLPLRALISSAVLVGLLHGIASCGPTTSPPPRPALTASPPAKAPPLEAQPVRIRGSCVDPVEDAFSREGGEPEDRDHIAVDRSLDLDGDGTKDSMVTLERHCGSGGCPHLIYLTRGSCAHYTGSLWGRSVEARPSRRNGLAVLQVDVHAGSTQWTEQLASYHEDGEYHVDEERRCEAQSFAAGVPVPPPLCSAWGLPER